MSGEARLFRCIKSNRAVKFTPPATSPIHALMLWARRRPRDAALIFSLPERHEPFVRTYSELFSRAFTLAESLASLPEGLIGILGGQHGLSVEAALAAMQARRPFALINPLSQAFEHEVQCLQSLHPLGVLIPSLDEMPDLLVDRLGEITRELGRANVWSAGPNPLAAKDLLAEDQGSRQPQDAVDDSLWNEPLVYLNGRDEDEHCHAYVYTPLALAASALSVAQWLQIKEGVRVLCGVELTRCAGFVPALAAVMSGAGCVLPHRLKGHEFWQVASQSGAHVARVAPEVIEDLLENPGRASDISSSGLKYIITDAGGLPTRVSLAFIETYDLPLINCFGTSATGGYALGVPLNLCRREYELALRDSAAGVELEHCNVKVEEDPQITASANDRREGYLAVRGNGLSTGYWDGQTLSTWQTPWLRTSHLGAVCGGQERECFSVQGRASEALVVQGYRIWPAQIEHSLTETFAFLEDCVVLARPDGRGRSQLCAAVVLPEELDRHRQSELLAQMEARVRAGGVEGLSEHARPHQLIALSGPMLPRDPDGRPNRQQLLDVINGFAAGRGLAAS